MKAQLKPLSQRGQAGGEFADLFDFCARIDLKKINRRVLERLIKAGAMDALGPKLSDGKTHRAALQETLSDAMRAADQHAKAEALGQHDLFGLINEEPEDTRQAFKVVPPWPEPEWLEGERKP